VRAEADLAKREPLLADRAIAPEEVRHARESVELARAALTQAVRQSTSSHAWSTARKWRTTRRTGGEGGVPAMRGSPRKRNAVVLRSPGMWPSAACNWVSTSKRGRRS